MHRVPERDETSTDRVGNDLTLPSRGLARARVLVGRALSRRCPYCGAAGIFSGWFTLRQRCPSCNIGFDREEGYFLGAYALNLIVAETVALGIALSLIFGTSLREASLLWHETIAVGLAVAMPLLFFPFSRTLWIALDLMLDPPGKESEERLRGRIDRR